MSDLTSLYKTDLLDDHKSDDYNRLLGGSLQAAFRNVETLTTTRELADSDRPIQVLTASGANRNCELAPVATTNHPVLIANGGGSNNIVVKDSTGATTYATLEPGEWCLAFSSGGIWCVIDSNAFSSAPFVDSGALVKGSSDATKLLRFEVDGFTTGTTRVMTPPNYDGTLATLAGTETLTNKRITKRVVTTTQSATPSINTDNGDIFEITGLAQAITSLTTNLTGTPTKGQMMQMWITDDGTGRAITPGASFAGTDGFSLTGLTTTAGKKLILLWQYSTVWELVGKLNSL